MKKSTYCIIMAGGIGSRFWPISTTQKPKQFLDILGVGKSLLRLTYERLLQICPSENFYVVTNSQYENIVLEQIPEFHNSQVLTEPLRRNTAPCIAYGVHEIKHKNPHANIIVAPSDHLILNEQEFISVLNSGIDIVNNNDVLLTLGIKPSRPDTGYGYIQIGTESFNNNTHIANKVKTFTEKPDIELANFFVDSKEFYWNSGIFLWSVQSISQSLQTHLPLVYDLFEHKLKDSSINDVYAECPNISIDFGVMEKADNVHVLQTDFGWSDLGTWGALYDNSHKDSKDNAIIAKDALVYNAHNNMISLPDHKVAIIDDVDDLIIVDSEERLLICKRSNEQKIRKYVHDIKLKKGDSFV
ncbi:MAG: mannose-1-phosphate guanylyltransferase [Bacteroidales bacterium]